MSDELTDIDNGKVKQPEWMYQLARNQGRVRVRTAFLTYKDEISFQMPTLTKDEEKLLNGSALVDIQREMSRQINRSITDAMMMGSPICSALCDRSRMKDFERKW